MKLIAILGFIVFPLGLSAQSSIRGRVVQETTGIPVPGSSVFISNTSKGTSTDANGYFELQHIPAGQHELVISSIGYETNVFAFNEKQLPLQLKIEMRIRVKELTNITLEPTVEEGWEKWGKIFLNNFVGFTANASRCQIRNSNSLKFRYYKKAGRLVAYADEPLLMENKALGYLVSYQLEEFEINFKEGSSVYLGYSLFEEMDTEKKNRDKRRLEAYHGSMMHFWRSLYTDSLEENGFELRRMIRIPNEEKKRVTAIYKTRLIETGQGSALARVEIKEPDLPPDTLEYYRRVMKQPDYTEVDGKDILTADSVFIEQDGSSKLCWFPEYLYITYNGELEEESYVRSRLLGRKPSFQRSFLFLPEGKPVWVERNGSYFNPRDIFSLGYWSWSDKMADNLPLDYQPRPVIPDFLNIKK